jgi:hypothetical protein
MAVMAAVDEFAYLLAGFDNRALVRAVTALLGCLYTSRQASDDQRWPKRKALSVRLPGHLPLPTHAAGSARRGNGHRRPWQPAR